MPQKITRTLTMFVEHGITNDGYLANENSRIALSNDQVS